MPCSFKKKGQHYYETTYIKAVWLTLTCHRSAKLAIETISLNFSDNKAFLLVSCGSVENLKFKSHLI